jgi:Fic family protein
MKRKYEETHPWIKFRIDLKGLPPRVWMLLGEARSKCEHIAGVPLKPELADAFYRVSLAKGVHATTAIEGNTLSAFDVEQRLEGKPLEVSHSKAYQVQEIDNIFEALNGVIAKELCDGSLSPLCPNRIKQFNALVLKDLQVEEDVVPGKLRHHSVTVGPYRGAPAEDCEFLLDRLCSWLNGPEFDDSSDPKELAIPIALLKAILAHVYLAWIHPFGDGNGRTARLVELQVLATAGVPDVACHLLSNHYNDTRAEYYRQLDRASKSGGNLLPFIEYAVQGFMDGLTQDLKFIRVEQWHVAWTNYVHEEFGKRAKTASASRMKDLVLELSKRSTPVPRKELTSLSAPIAVAYNDTTDKTLSRDLNALEAMGLIKRAPEGIAARKDLILAFLPNRYRKPRASQGAVASAAASPGVEPVATAPA